VGTDVLESHVEELAVVRKFEGHPGNDVLVAVMSFLET
jgi:hypothetical protein